MEPLYSSFHSRVQMDFVKTYTLACAAAFREHALNEIKMRFFFLPVYIFPYLILF